VKGPSKFRAEGAAIRVDAVEPETEVRPGALAAVLGQQLILDLAGLEAFFFARWDRQLFDLLVVAAAAEFCDRVKRRPAHGWSRGFDLRVAVHDPDHWAQPEIQYALEDALGFLTGDVWHFTFCKRLEPAPEANQVALPLSPGAALIMPYSEGLDSLAVHAITRHVVPGEIVRVRLGSGGVDSEAVGRDRQPFARVPYRVKTAGRAESSARSRGFKFAVVTAIAAIMSGVSRIVVTESGQGALGPVLVRTGHAYADYRVHPAFTRKMELLIEALTGRTISYLYPRLWNTKGETLREAAALPTPPNWQKTRSCWQGAQQVSVDGARRQCGVCAACMLRRLSMYTADIDEPQETYVWENLSTADFRAGAAASFRQHTPALDQYGIAGVLHLDHLAALSTSVQHRRHVRRIARLTADAIRQDAELVESQIYDLLARHASEWRAFVLSRGADSFVRRYAASVTA
jgi:hypothetical protein